MSSAVAELDGYLQQMLALKPPGVSGSKISSITSLCTANVQVCLSKEILFPYSSRKQTFLHAHRETGKLFRARESV